MHTYVGKPKSDGMDIENQIRTLNVEPKNSNTPNMRQKTQPTCTPHMGTDDCACEHVVYAIKCIHTGSPHALPLLTRKTTWGGGARCYRKKWDVSNIHPTALPENTNPHRTTRSNVQIKQHKRP